MEALIRFLMIGVMEFLLQLLKIVLLIKLAIEDGFF